MTRRTRNRALTAAVVLVGAFFLLWMMKRAEDYEARCESAGGEALCARFAGCRCYAKGSLVDAGTFP